MRTTHLSGFSGAIVIVFAFFNRCGHFGLLHPLTFSNSGIDLDVQRRKGANLVARRIFAELAVGYDLKLLFSARPEMPQLNYKERCNFDPSFNQRLHRRLQQSSSAKSYERRMMRIEARRKYR